MKNVLLVLAIAPLCLFAQSRKEKKAVEAQHKADVVVVENLKKHIKNLSNVAIADNIGREGLEYISGEFKSIGLQPKNSDGFIEPYTIDEGKKIDSSTYLKINSNPLEINKEYFPLSYSAEKKVTGKPAMALRERGVPWFIDVKQWLEGDTKIEQSNLPEAIKKEIARVATKGATALFLYNSGTEPDNITYNGKEKTNPSAIPVIYLTRDGYKKYFNDHSEMLDVDLNVAFKDGVVTGANVAGLINNLAPSTIVITTSLSALAGSSYPSPGNVKTGDQVAVNSNSIATLIELAKMISASKAKSNNYIFSVFGGGDEGVSASKYWLENSAAILQPNYVINLDLPGGLSETKKLIVQGVQSSPIWADAVTTTLDKKMDFSIDSSANFSDRYAVYYKKGIPELLFSSATKHNVTAREGGAENFTKYLQLAKMLQKLVETVDTKGKLAFSKIADPIVPATNVAQRIKTIPLKARPNIDLASSVSLGVIPDKIKNDVGLKIIGVSQKKLASKIGLQAGDVLMELGDYKIADLNSYMDALSNFKTGDKTTLRIKRGKDDKEFAVEF